MYDYVGPYGKSHGIYRCKYILGSAKAMKMNIVQLCVIVHMGPLRWKMGCIVQGGYLSCIISSVSAEWHHGYKCWCRVGGGIQG